MAERSTQKKWKNIRNSFYSSILQTFHGKTTVLPFLLVCQLLCNTSKMQPCTSLLFLHMFLPL